MVGILQPDNKDKIIADNHIRILELEQEISKWKSWYELMESHAEYAHTYFWDEHPEDHNEPCICYECRGYMANE